MKRGVLTLLLTGGCWLALEQTALAQIPNNQIGVNPTARPTFSPYLNLLRGGTNPAINYYGIVRPEIEFRNSMNQLQQQLNSVQASVPTTGDAANLPVTGHSTRFMTYSHYFPQKGGAAGRPGGGQSSTVAPSYPTGGIGGAATLGGGSRSPTPARR